MVSTTVYVPVSLNLQFATQLELLVRSLERNAELPGPWNVVVTVSQDAVIGLEHAALAWTEKFPVEFRWVEDDLWRRHHWAGTSHQQSLYHVDTDVALFLDADTFVVGSLKELIENSASVDEFAAWPAWQPPPKVDLDEIFRQLGLTVGDYGVTYSGYALDFMEPRDCPLYFNAGVAAVSGRLANEMTLTYPPEFERVSQITKSHFRTQLALAANLMRQGYGYRALDMRYNASNGDFDVPIIFDNAEAVAADKEAHAALADARILHYCVQSEEFQRTRDMVGLGAVREFCARRPVHSGSRRLQKAFVELISDL